jgi:hypothetical protein
MLHECQPAFRGLTDVGFWDKSHRIFKLLFDHGTQSVRQLADQTGFSKSSVYRLTQAMARRNRHPESWLWETPEGRQWLLRLVVAALYTFGCKRGVGVETISEFLVRLHLETQIGCSPSALRSLMQKVEVTLVEMGQRWEQEGVESGKVREIVGGVDETFLQLLMLVFLDLPTGYLILEEVAEDRSYDTWQKWVKERLETLGTDVLYLVSDRAKALVRLAVTGLECLSMPDFFHVTHEIVKSYSLALGRHLRQAHQRLQDAQERAAKHAERDPASPARVKAQAEVEASQAEVNRWEEAKGTYRNYLESLSLGLHPFDLSDSTPQTSEQVESRLRATVAAIQEWAASYGLPSREEAMTKVLKQLPDLAALVDFWWACVWQDLEGFALSPLWKSWIQECLLPMMYWQAQLAQTRGARKKAKIRQALEAVQARFMAHAITQGLDPDLLEQWQDWAAQRVSAFQRTSSAVEGRNGVLSGLHHNHRGLPKQRFQVWRVLHNFDCRASDGTTPAARFFSHEFPDLFETVLSHIDELPRARQRRLDVA